MTIEDNLIDLSYSFNYRFSDLMILKDTASTTQIPAEYQ